VAKSLEKGGLEVTESKVERKFVITCDPEAKCIRCVMLNPKLSTLDVRELIHTLRDALFDYVNKEEKKNEKV
jgi:hypothetical protein